MSVGGWYFPLLWVSLIGGLAPGLYFVATFRPRRSGFAASIDTAGLAVVIVLLYLRSVLVLVLGARPPATLEAAVTGLGFGFGIDALLWLRAWRWFHLRRKLRR